MNIAVLGASGGLGGMTGSTCVQVSERILIDVGTGVSQLLLKQMQQVRHIFLTHSHSDHIACLPMLLGNLFNVADAGEPVTVYGSADTIAAIQAHVFNWVIWPDMQELPSKAAPLLRLQTITAGQTIAIDGISLTPFATYHTVPTFGYSICKEQQHTVYVADTGYASSLVEQINQLGMIDDIILECSFPNELAAVAKKSCHLTPQLCLQLLAELTQPPKRVWINHLKPDLADEVHKQLRQQHPPQGWQVLL
ncbi:MAG: 3',5'-cyclic-nucleotide phosphodiesterase [Pseudidiomarina maritima]|nr:3',5'-cyclic-nucleotide phosphodiesterase [Pseudidiomarina maritima]